MWAASETDGPWKWSPLVPSTFKRTGCAACTHTPEQPITGPLRSGPSGFGTLLHQRDERRGGDVCVLDGPPPPMTGSTDPASPDKVLSAAGYLSGNVNVLNYTLSQQWHTCTVYLGSEMEIGSSYQNNNNGNIVILPSNLLLQSYQGLLNYTSSQHWQT